MGFFPYAPRPFQDVARALVAEATGAGGHLVLEMPTGSGKTVVLLSGALETARKLGKRVLYVSRTNSQQEQTIREFNAIREASGEPLRGRALQGRARLCPKLEESRDPEWSEATSEELSHFCSAAKKATDQNLESPKACRYYARLKDLAPEALESALGGPARTAEWIKAESSRRGICPYEATKRLLLDADLVVAPYIFAFDPGLRRRLLEWWGCRESDVILVIDEAHNVPSYLRELHSPRMTREKLRRALAEAHELGDPEILKGVGCRQFLETLAGVLESVVAEYCKEEDGFLPPFEVEAALLERFATTTRSLSEAANAMAQLGEIVKDRRRLLGRIPRSHLSHVAAFVHAWLGADEEGFVKLAGREPGPNLEAFLVDSARAGAFLAEFHATVHASGTLAPLEEYQAALGLPEATRLERFPSPFPADCLTVLAIQGVTSRYEDLQADPGAVDRLQEATRRVVASSRMSTACFFPSHRLLEEFREIGVFQGVSSDPLFEARDLTQQDLMALVARHRAGAGSSLLVGVLGGRLSEGIDFPGRQLEAVVVVGVPYPKPTAHQRALVQYFETRCGRGWDYAVRAPALRRLRQALGRLVRSETDRGIAVLVDERAGPLLASAGVEAELLPLEEALRRLDAWTPGGAIRLSETGHSTRGFHGPAA